MKVLQKINTRTGLVTCAEIGRFDADLLRQFFEVRTAIWTYKYPEKPGKDGLERDGYDPQSSYVVLLEGESSFGTVIGGCRVIHAENGSTLPVGECSRIPIGSRAVEISRFFFSPGNETAKSESSLLFRGMIAGLTTLLTSEGFDRAYAVIRESLFEKLRAFGLPMVRIGPDQRHGGWTFVPAMMFEALEDATSETACRAVSVSAVTAHA